VTPLQQQCELFRHAATCDAEECCLVHNIVFHQENQKKNAGLASITLPRPSLANEDYSSELHDAKKRKKRHVYEAFAPYHSVWW